MNEFDNKKNLDAMITRFGLSQLLMQISEICQERSKKIPNNETDVTAMNLSNAWSAAGAAVDMVAQCNGDVRIVSDLIL